MFSGVPLYPGAEVNLGGIGELHPRWVRKKKERKKKNRALELLKTEMHIL